MKYSEDIHAETELPLLKKKAAEKLVFEIDLALRLIDDQSLTTLNSVTVTALASNPASPALEATNPSLVPDGAATRVRFLAQKGVAGEAYRLTFNVDAGDDVVLIDDLVIEVS